MIFSCENNLDKEITTEMLNDGYIGKGTHTYGKGEWEGEKYVGEYKDGKMHRQGTYTWTSGDKYVGEFKNDGPWDGTIYDEDGRKLLKFVNGERIEQSPPIKTID